MSNNNSIDITKLMNIILDPNSKTGRQLQQYKKDNADKIFDSGSLPFAPKEATEKARSEYAKLLIKCAEEQAKKVNRISRKSGGLKQAIELDRISGAWAKNPARIYGKKHYSNELGDDFYAIKTLTDIEGMNPDKYLYDVKRYKKRGGIGVYERDVKSLLYTYNLYLDGRAYRADAKGYFPAYSDQKTSYLYWESKYPEKYPYFAYAPYLANKQKTAKDYVYWYDTSELVKDKRTGGTTYLWGKRKGQPRYARRRSSKDWSNNQNINAREFMQKIEKEFNRKAQRYNKKNKDYTVTLSAHLNKIYGTDEYRRR